jgi:hypothetical protein
MVGPASPTAGVAIRRDYALNTRHVVREADRKVTMARCVNRSFAVLICASPRLVKPVKPLEVP